MKKMADIRKMSDKELQELITERREEMRSSRFNQASRNVRAVRTARHEVARALTELTARGKAASQEESK